MKDQNGLTLKCGDDVLYCDGHFQVAGEYDGRAIIWATDPGMCAELIVVDSELLKVHAPIRGFWRWLTSVLRESQIPRKPRPGIAHALCQEASKVQNSA